MCSVGMLARSQSDQGAGAIWVPPPTPTLHRRQDDHASSDGPRAVVGSTSFKNIGKDPENQDAFVTGQNQSGSRCFVGVFDGHGEKGKLVSHFARDTLSKSLMDHQDLGSNPRLALENAYHEAQRQIEHKMGSHAAESGTTAVAAYQHRNRLFVANVGDSRAVLGRYDTARGHMETIELSSDHKPNRADERQRILAAGGKIDQSVFPVAALRGNGVRWIRAGPERVMDRSGLGGLAVSRSLGDLRLRPFVSSTPEVIERKLDGRDKFLVLGTDGIWDHISSKEAVDIAHRHGDPTEASHEIAGLAKKRWKKATGGRLSDDITAVVVRLDATGTNLSRSSSSVPGTPAGSASGHRRSSNTRIPQVESSSSPLEKSSLRPRDRMIMQTSSEGQSFWGKGRLALEPLSPKSPGSPQSPSQLYGLSPAGGRRRQSRPASTGQLQRAG